MIEGRVSSVIDYKTFEINGGGLGIDGKDRLNDLNPPGSCISSFAKICKIWTVAFKLLMTSEADLPRQPHHPLPAVSPLGT